jgi:hypothetical protein
MSIARIDLPCPGCGRSLSPGAGEHAAPPGCPRCGESIPLAGGTPPEGSAPRICLVCGCPDLHWRKDFPQKAGCLIVLAGAALVPWTWGLSLAVVALVDLILYRALPKVAVCYVCRARYRGVPPHPSQGPYDLLTAQRREARALDWREGRLRPAFTPSESAAAHGDAGTGDSRRST